MTASRSKLPRVTVGVPAYNAAPYIGQTLEGLLAQTFGDIEIVVSDNASTDETPDIVESYAARDRRIRLERNPRNLGAGRNFQRCIELARCELFRWASADDLSAPTFIERCVEVLDREPDVVQVYPRTVLVDHDGRELSKYDDNIETLADRARDRYRHVMANMELVNGLYGVMRTAMLRRTMGHGSYVGADLILQAEIALHGKIKEVPEYLFFRRIHAEAHSALTSADQQRFENPRTETRPEMRSWRDLWKRLASVRASPLPVREKALIGLDIVGWGFQMRGQLVAELTVRGRERLEAERGAARDRIARPSA